MIKEIGKQINAQFSIVKSLCRTKKNNLGLLLVIFATGCESSGANIEKTSNVLTLHEARMYACESQITKDLSASECECVAKQVHRFSLNDRSYNSWLQQIEYEYSQDDRNAKSLYVDNVRIEALYSCGLVDDKQN